MAMMKYKNDAGEWVAVAPTNFMHQFKMITVAPLSDNKGWDFSPYLQKNSDFIVGFVAGASSAMTAPGYMWHRAGNRLVANMGRAESFIPLNPTNPLDIFMNEEASAIPEFMEIVYDDETRILKVVKDDNYTSKIGTACLIYAG